MPDQAYTSPDAPAPAASYSPAARHGNLLQVSGQVGLTAAGQIAGSDVATQTHQALRNVRALLAAAGASMRDVLMLRVHLTDPEHFAAMNAAYADHVTEPFPARTTVYTGLNPGFLVEVDALAVLAD